ncbi:uncharacterized protein LOC127873091 [Dreissena polymorpha]|uniref:Peptidase M12B domain-containing protein n=1 Tax=Dreissena polymorpha TaxID=45954 RepID=A0A9D4MS03_DREPO|nr:uncharacterized protein LOC127873091 [Dreissena polymorpha]KAH3881155.1 hypothetical protein DPMN_005078 [Dreissena polymorpha]
MEIHGPYPEIRNLKDWLHDDSTEPYISNSESDEDDGAEETISKPRAKRQTATITVELFMVIDFAIYDWWDRLAKDLGQHTDTVTLIETHFGYVFREIDLRLQNLKEQDYTIKAALAGTYVARRESESNWTLGSTLEVDATSPRIMVNSSEALEKFQSWIDTNIDLPHFDHAILFTGTNLSYAGSAGNTGLAFGSSMCLNISKSSIVEDTFDTRTVTFATQQIVRSLGSRDDMDNNDCLEFFNYIMAQKFKLPIRSFASNKWKFSSCSEQYVKMYLHELDVAGMNCLKETRVSQPNPDRPASVNEKPVGFVYSPKEQCQHKFGATSDVCRVAIGTRYSKICVGLLCVVPETGVCDYIFPADGTTCGYNKYCWHGNCDEFEDGEDVSDTCAYGNDPTVNCNEMIMNDMAVCYNETVRFACCQSCEKIMIDFPGCEFGDRSGQCQISKCIAGNKTLTSHTCCLTCVDGPTPYVPPLERLLFDTSTVSVFRTTDVTTPSTIFPSILTRATTHTLLSNVGENVETPITTNTIISSPNDTVTSIGDTGIRSKTMTAEQMTSSASSASSASTTAADITEYSVTTLKTESLTDVTDPSLTAPHVSSTPSTYNLDKQTTIELTRYTNPTSAMSKPSGKCVCLPETIITETVATTADPQYLEAPASTLAPQHRSTTADTRPTPQTNTDRPLYIAVSRIMRQCQRYTRSVVHDDLNLLYTSVTSRLRYYGGEFEHEVESQKEANENGSSETLDINRTLKPLWVTQYLRIMRHLDLNIRDMRYKVLATLNRHAQTNA